MLFPTTALRAACCFLLLLLGSLAFAPAHAATTGEQKTAVILVNFSDKATQPVTVAAAHNLVFGAVSDYLWETSYQRLVLSGDTFGWFTIPVSSSQCSRALIADEGKRAATAAGADLSAYGRIIYMFPTNTGCSWSGVAGVAQTGEKQVFINNSFSTYVIAHEIGHTLGLLHSDALDCDTGTLGASCQQRSAGDVADGMGSRLAHFNAFQKEQLGWLDPAQVTTVHSSGRYVIEPMSGASQGGPKALKILKDTDPVTGDQTWYYVEYRQPMGSDDGLASSGNLVQGVLVRTGSLGAANFPTSLLLDMTPGSSSTTDLADAALGVGRRYQDPAAGVSLTVVAADSGGAVVDVVVSATGATGCTRAAPALGIAGPATAAAAGSTVNYTISLTNGDEGDCGSTAFSLARSLPSGWTGTFSAPSLTLGPGESGTVVLAVASPATVAAGTYALGVGTGSDMGAVHATNASASYTVAPATSLTAAIGTNKASYLRGEIVVASALIKNSGAAVGGATVVFALTQPDGNTVSVAAPSGSDGYARASFRLGKAKSAAGNYSLRATATSDGANATATTGFSVR